MTTGKVRKIHFRWRESGRAYVGETSVSLDPRHCSSYGLVQWQLKYVLYEVVMYEYSTRRAYFVRVTFFECMHSLPGTRYY